MNDELKIKLLEFMLDCKDPHKLAEFYAALLKWEIVFDYDEYAGVYPLGLAQGAYPCIAFQRNTDYEPPVWPEEPDAQQQMAHIDFAVNDLEKAVEHAIQCGATVADKQFDEHCRVMLDPAGHPFCLCLNETVFTVNG